MWKQPLPIKGHHWVEHQPTPLLQQDRQGPGVLLSEHLVMVPVVGSGQQLDSNFFFLALYDFVHTQPPFPFLSILQHLFPIALPVSTNFCRSPLLKHHWLLKSLWCSWKGLRQHFTKGLRSAEMHESWSHRVVRVQTATLTEKQT